ncbi:hypothetical protein [Alloalcanivorax xenomutans]|uniref:hypothetical protein n=1 Tax=Alloalcanivorax xenomutans TaxID=1094342 RepID=UPI0003B83CF4|nr:hypothetical protein Q668_06445 [Alcanivorax sp. PN-3]
MSDENTIMSALFQQQRIQIMDMAVHHGEYADHYLYAWYDGIYPFLDDTDGSVIRMPHEIYEDFFKIPKHKVEVVFNRLCDAFDNSEGLTFYDLEDEYKVRESSEWDRMEIRDICRYFYLEGCFDDELWGRLLTPMKHPSEAASIVREFDREKDIYFM